MAVDDELSTPILHHDDNDHHRHVYSDDELNEVTGCGASCCNPSSRCHRFLALILMCLVGFGKILWSMFCSDNSPLCVGWHGWNANILFPYGVHEIGSYFCYDNPGALQDYFIKDMQLTTTQFVWLYSIYSWPNVVLCFVGGFLMDR